MMKETYVQKYIIENYILIAIVIGTYFITYIKSAVDNFIKKMMTINMSLLLLLSIAGFYINYCREQKIVSSSLIVTMIIYYSIKPLIMTLIIVALKPKIKKIIYIPLVLNFICYYVIVLRNGILHLEHLNINELEFLLYPFIITNCVYWIIFLLVLDIKLYKNIEVNHLQVFFCITWLMTATILELVQKKEGVLSETYAIIFLFYYLTLHVKISQQITEEKDVKLREQRMALMLSQIQPHFLYNTLNTITALCRINPKLAEETTIKFSGYLRENMYNMEKNDVQLFSKELDHTKIYVDIEKLRFGNRVKVEYEIESEDFYMPTLTLQPIVENAIKHGICNRLEGGTVKIITQNKEKENIIIITDNGLGFDMEKIVNDGKVHIGIKNVRERLKSIVNAEFEIISFIGMGTTVRITIPKERKKEIIKRGKRREILSIGR